MHFSDRRKWGLVRVVAAVSATGLWISWWVAASRHAPSETRFVLWLASLVLWGLALSAPWACKRPGRSAIVAGVVTSLALIPRVWSLADAPYGIYYDEIIHPFIGLAVLHDHPWSIFRDTSKYFQTPYLTHVLQAWPCLFLDPLTGARLASVVLGAGSLVCTYALAARLFGARVAVVTITILACSFWHIVTSRLAYPYMQPMVLVPGALYVVTRGVSEDNRFLQLAGGMLLGLSALVYTPARIVVPIVLLWIMHRVVCKQLRPRAAAGVLLVSALGAVLVLSPYLHTRGLGDVLSRYRQTTSGHAGPLHLLSEYGWTSTAGRALLEEQTWAATRVYFSGRARFGVEHVIDHPLLDGFSLALVLIGMCIVVARPRNSDRLLLLVWIIATFVFGQVLTDVPTAAYRAAPLLPALAMCGGLGGVAVIDMVRRVRFLSGAWIQTAVFLILVAVVLPWNLLYLRDYMMQRRRDTVAGMARLIRKGPKDAVYYLVSPEPWANQALMQFVGGGRSLRDVPSLSDALGNEIDDRHDAVFVLHPLFVDAVATIRRCYPGAALIAETSPVREDSILAVAVSRRAVVAGEHCRPPVDGPGLLARYFSGAAWDGAVIREQNEAWPYRYAQANDRFASAEWSGTIRIPATGDFRFRISTREGATGEVLIPSKLELTPQREESITFEAGRYPITIRCVMPHGGGYCWLQWAPPGGDYALVPPEFFEPRVGSGQS